MGIGKGLQQIGWKVRVCPVEVECRGFIARSNVSSSLEMGVHGESL